MRITTIVASLALAAGGSAMAAAQAQSGPDSFAINIDIEQLKTAEGARAFDERLRRQAHSYCHSEAPTASESSLRDCEARVVAAVQDAVSNQAANEGTAVLWRSAGL